MDIFNRGKILFKDIFYSEIQEHTTFVYLRSIFRDKWYNLIEPKVFEEQLDWQEVAQIMQNEEANNISVSFYIHQLFLDNYTDHLEGRGYTAQADEVYMYREINGLNNVLSTGFAPITAQNYPAFVQLAEACFPEYSNNEAYCKVCFDIAQSLQQQSNEKQNYNFLYHENGAYLAFGSVLVSREQKLAYLHNMGTHPSARRRGLFSKLTAFLTNQAAELGATTIYVNAEHESASFKGFQKMGFHFDCRYHLFSK